MYHTITDNNFFAQLRLDSLIARLSPLPLTLPPSNVLNQTFLHQSRSKLFVEGEGGISFTYVTLSVQALLTSIAHTEATASLLFESKFELNPMQKR